MTRDALHHPHEVKGDTEYFDGVNWRRLAIGAASAVLRVVGGIPAWQAVASFFGAPTGAIDIGDAQADGTATTAARSDHQHANTAPGAGYPLDVATAEADGTAATAARSDHVHGIANDAVTYAKIQNVAAASRLLGRGSAAGAGDPEEITLGSGLSMSGTALSATAAGGVVSVQAFTASGTYTPTAGMDYCIVEMVAGGGGGGGADNSDACVSRCGAGGGGAGEFARRMLTAAQIGASQTVTIGAAGAAGSSSGATGGNGGNTSLGVLASANGGSGGTGAVGGSNVVAGGLGGTGGSAADYQAPGQPGQPGFGTGATALAIHQGGTGGSSPFGGGGRPGLKAAAGEAGVGRGSGGGGGSAQSTTGKAGGAGTAGYIIITEFAL